MKRIFWEEDALADLEQAIGYIARHDRFAALSVERKMLDAIERLAARDIGRPGKIPGTFEKRVLRTPYRIVYRASDQELTILRVIHQSRDWPAGGELDR